MQTLPALVEKLSEFSKVPAVNAMFLEPLKEQLEAMDKFQQMVEQTIDLDAADKGDFFVKAEFDDELKGGQLWILSSVFSINANSQF